jgi:hypothetical protein
LRVDVERVLRAPFAAEAVVLVMPLFGVVGALDFLP